MYQIKTQKAENQIIVDALKFIAPLTAQHAFVLADVNVTRKIPFAHSGDQLNDGSFELTKSEILVKLNALYPDKVFEFVSSVIDGVYHNDAYIAFDTNDILVDTKTGHYYMFALVDMVFTNILVGAKYQMNEIHIPVQEIDYIEKPDLAYIADQVITNNLNIMGVQRDLSAFDRPAGVYNANGSGSMLVYLAGKV